MSYIKYNKNFDGTDDVNNFWLKIENEQWHHHGITKEGYYLDGVLVHKNN